MVVMPVTSAAPGSIVRESAPVTIQERSNYQSVPSRLFCACLSNPAISGPWMEEKANRTWVT